MNLINKLKRSYIKLRNSSALRKNKVKFAKFHINGILHIVNNGGVLVIGNNFSANSGKNENPIGGDTRLNLIVFKAGAALTIGENVGISNSTIVCWEKIDIGNNVVIGGSCKIWDTNFHSLDPAKRISGKDTDIKTSPVRIGDNVFIGGNVMILKGVTIGANSIIAAGSVVNSDVPPNVIAGGNPCKVIKELIP